MFQPFGYSSMFGGFFSIFTIVFLLILGVIIFTLISNARRWNKNNNSPRLTVEATVVTKRMSTSRHTHHNMNHASHTSYTDYYYVTFQFESGDRLELGVDGQQYGLLVEGDVGKLTFQGTRYLSFDRVR